MLTFDWQNREGRIISVLLEIRESDMGTLGTEPVFPACTVKCKELMMSGEGCWLLMLESC